MSAGCGSALSIARNNSRRRATTSRSGSRVRPRGRASGAIGGRSRSARPRPAGRRQRGRRPGRWQPEVAGGLGWLKQKRARGPPGNDGFERGRSPAEGRKDG